jgi:peptidoglycan/LPS O-acetylase OafA/YrhL
VEGLNQLRGRAVYIDLIRTVAMVAVLLLHASGQWIITSQEMSQLNHLEIIRWGVVDVYQSVGVMGVPLFLMLTGVLLLQPESAREANLPIIDVYSALASYPNYFPDGVHANSAAAELIANEVYKAIISQNTST